MLTTVNFLLNTANSLACRHGFLKIFFSYYNNFSRLRELLFLYYDYDAPLCTGNNPKLQRDACTTPTFSPKFRKISIDYSKLKLSHNVSGFPNLTNSVRSYFIKWSKFFYVLASNLQNQNAFLSGFLVRTHCFITCRPLWKKIILIFWYCSLLS